ncbi:MAG: hypothetical protein ACRD2L_04725 [Terriglobia bacterium]
MNEVIDAEVLSAETVVPEPKPEQLKLAVYDVTVVTKFQITGPAEVPDPRMLERALWESMPAGYIGGELFVKFPPGARNFNVKIEAIKSDEPVPEPQAEPKMFEKEEVK